jgi:hypothetical protein
MEHDGNNNTKFDFSDIVKLVNDGQIDQAINILDGALEDFKIVGELLNVRALIHQLQNQPDEAIATFKAALLVNDKNPEFAKNLFNCFRHSSEIQSFQKSKVQYQHLIGDPSHLNEIEQSLTLEDNILYCIWDLNLNNIASDILHFIVLSEIERREKNLPGLYFIFIPGLAEGFRNVSHRDMQMNASQKNWRLRYLSMPYCWLAPNCQGVTIMPSREYSQYFFDKLDNYNHFPTYQSSFAMREITRSAKAGNDVQLLRAPQYSLDYAQSWLTQRAGDKKVIAVTIRESKVEPQRNADLNAWKQFINHLEKLDYFVLVIPDTESVLDGTSESDNWIQSFAPAAMSIELRAAFYALAYLNVSAACGPASMQFFMADVPFLTFNPDAPGLSSPDSIKSLMGIDFAGGETIPFLRRHQKFIYGAVDYEILVREFTRHILTLESL